MNGKEIVPADHQPPENQENHIDGETSSNPPILLDEDFSEIPPQDQTSSTSDLDPNFCGLLVTPEGDAWFRRLFNIKDSPAEDEDEDDQNNSTLSDPIKFSRYAKKRWRGAPAAAAAADGGDYQTGGLLRAVRSCGGNTAELLYKKKLENSDVDKVQHRLLLSGGERVMKFLSVEEAAAVDGGGNGLTMVGVDGGGNVYENLVMIKWGKVRVIRSDWNDVVAANNVKKNDVMEIWGFRVNRKSCLAFNFRREREERDGDGDEEDDHAAAASTPSSSNGESSS